MSVILDKTDPRIAYLIKYPELLLWRDYFQELVTIPERLIAHEKDNKIIVETETPLYVGKLVGLKDYFYRVESFEKIDHQTYSLEVSETQIPFTTDLLLFHRTPFVLQKGDIENYNDDAEIVTAVGRFILNYVLLVNPFYKTVPYINDIWKISKIESIVGDLVINQVIDSSQFNKYANNLMYLGNSPEFVSPNLTPKALTTDPDIEQKKAALIEKYRDRLEKGDASVMVQIQTELIKIDKNYLKDDEAMNYFLKAKIFDNVRKKLFLTHGMVEGFGKPGQFEFVENSLEQGWTKKSFPIIVNEIRDGSYSRSTDVAKGGTETKFLLRVFQNTRIVMEDCGTQKTEDVYVHKNNAQDFVYRNYVDNGEIKTVSQTDYTSFIGETVKFRSPLFCVADKGGFCFTCMGKIFKTLDQKVMTTITTDIGNSILSASLKRMHGTSLSLEEISDLNYFVA